MGKEDPEARGIMRKDDPGARGPMRKDDLGARGATRKAYPEEWVMGRREFLIASSVGAAFATVAHATPAVASPGWPAGMTGGAAEIPSGASVHADAGFAEVHAIVYEPRYAVSCDFVRQHATPGVQVFRSDECMVHLWRGPLVRRPEAGGELMHATSQRTADRLSAAAGAPRNAEAPRAPGTLRIAGATLYSDFAIARDCARDLGLRVLREEWLSDAQATLVTWLIGSS